MTSKGQVTIPKLIRQKLALVPGDDVLFEETSNGMLVCRATPVQSPFDKYRGCLASLSGSDPDVLLEEMRGR
jgi:AbrB family looped-hinge helix DNA binding protein